MWRRRRDLRAQNSAGHPEEPVAERNGEQPKGLPVTLLCALDESGIHASTVVRQASANDVFFRSKAPVPGAAAQNGPTSLPASCATAFVAIMKVVKVPGCRNGLRVGT